MVLLEDSTVISPLLLQNPKLQDILIRDFIKLDIFNKTRITKIYNLKYNLHLASVFWSTNYTYHTAPTSSTDKEIEIPVYTNVFIKLNPEEAIVKKYPIYSVLVDTPSLSQSVGTLTLTNPLNRPEKKKRRYGSTLHDKNTKTSK